MSTIKVNKIENTNTTAGGVAIDSSGHVQVDGLQMPSAGPLSNRNKIINGDMRIDQRNAGAAVSPMSGAYAIDRWTGSYLGGGVGRFSAQQSSTAPSGFTKSWLITVTTDDSAPSSTHGYCVYQAIEGYNIADLGFGTASASSIAVSFWVRSSVTGTFPLIIYNGAGTRAYGATYTISLADTFEYKTISIAGDTTGTWATDNTAGLYLIFGFGGGSGRTLSTGWQAASGSTPTNVTGSTSLIATNGATFYITGVQLEVGSKATPFEHRSYADELQRCQRYFQQLSQTTMLVATTNGTTQLTHVGVPLGVAMRALPTVNPMDYTCWHSSSGNKVASNKTMVIGVYNTNAVTCKGVIDGFTGLTDDKIASVIPQSTLQLSSEL